MKDLFIFKAIKMSYRLYKRIGSIVFGAVLIPNFTYGLLNPKDYGVIDHPVLFTIWVVSKSALLGIFWPSVSILLFTHPRRLYAPGGLLEMIDK